MVCGPQCSLFCIILSFLGFVFLPILGSLVDNEYEPLGELNWDSRHTTAQNCYTAAIIYAVTFLISAARLAYLKKYKKPVADTPYGTYALPQTYNDN